MVSCTPWPLYHRGKNPRYSLDRRLSGAQRQFGRSAVQKNLILPLAGIKLRSPNPSLYRVSYLGSLGKLVPHHDVRGETETWLHSILISTINGGQQPAEVALSPGNGTWYPFHRKVSARHGARLGTVSVRNQTPIPLSSSK
jgi:hypothetical protein